MFYKSIVRHELYSGVTDPFVRNVIILVSKDEVGDGHILKEEAGKMFAVSGSLCKVSTVIYFSKFGMNSVES